MAIVRVDGHVARAMRFMEQDDVYIALGKSTPWENEAQPPIPDINEPLVDLVVMKKVETKILVVLDDENGTIQYFDHKYSPVAPEDAIAKGARWVYCMSYFSYSEAPVSVSYRQVALQTGVRRKSSVPSAQYVLLPNEIEEMGITEIIDQIEPIYRRADKREKVGIIAEF